MYVGPGPEWDTERWQRAIPTSITTTQRIEVWSEGIMLTETAPGILDGAVTHDWVTAGVSRSLSMMVDPSRAWLRWLSLPSLEIRPWQGIRFSRRLTMECPLGVFPVQPPAQSLPATAIQIQAADYMEWVVDGDFIDTPMPRPAGRLIDAIGWLVAGAGLPKPINRSAATGSSPQVLLEGTRIDALADAARAAGVEVTADRVGDPQITNAQVLGPAVSKLLTGTGGTCIGVRSEPNWSQVHNVVAVKSSASGIEFPAVTATIGWTGHPAHPFRLGSPQRPRYKVLHYSSPLLENEDQAAAAARTILAREAAVAETYSFDAFPDPTRDAGDSTLGATPTGNRTLQIIQAVHPLRQVPARVTSASTAVNL